jgi:hypothetical protein
MTVIRILYESISYTNPHMAAALAFKTQPFLRMYAQYAQAILTSLRVFALNVKDVQNVILMDAQLAA